MTPESSNPEPLIEVKNLKKFFPIRKGLFGKVVGHVKAVDDVSFHVGRGETLGLVGESGCGKTTAGRSVLRLIEPTAGSVIVEGVDFLKLEGETLRAKRKDLQIIFQDPYGSLNPRMTVGAIVGEGMVVHGLAKGEELTRRVKDLLHKVGLNPNHYNRYPHEFSGGQRQRIGVARALAVSPKFIVCDEPVSALDVSIQAQIINLLAELRDEFHLSYLFVAHDLSVVEHLSNRVAVMYLGKIVETATSEDLYRSPQHPYTQALLDAIPVADPKKKRDRLTLKGDVPSPVNPPSGCYFHPRCPLAEEKCRVEAPPWVDCGGSHFAACHLVKPGGGGADIHAAKGSTAPNP
ncbi:MAG: dipeptide ABC transporter ATP-binding protein [Planctomycetes bacterium]|nr:dipeptide ABC transporter ATP-binding protein [Planctomycetota bacterium]